MGSCAYDLGCCTLWFGLRVKVQGFRFRVQGSGVCGLALGLSVQGFRFRVQGLGVCGLALGLSV